MNAFTANQMRLIEDIRDIRSALHIGLDSFGEIERVLGTIKSMEDDGVLVDQSMKPRSPAVDSGTIGIFATALVLLDALEPRLTSALDPA
jgi:hypothetical protein